MNIKWKHSSTCDADLTDVYLHLVSRYVYGHVIELNIVKINKF